MAIAVVLLVLCGTGVIDLDALVPHEDDCADTCCRTGAAPHCTCCCASHHLSLAPEEAAPPGADPHELAASAPSVLLHPERPLEVFHPPRA